MTKLEASFPEWQTWYIVVTVALLVILAGIVVAGAFSGVDELKTSKMTVTADPSSVLSNGTAVSGAIARFTLRVDHANRNMYWFGITQQLTDVIRVSVYGPTTGLVPGEGAPRIVALCGSNGADACSPSAPGEYQGTSSTVLSGSIRDVFHDIVVTPSRYWLRVDMLTSPDGAVAGFLVT